MKTYYVHGWHGNLNAGDDAFAIVVNWGLQKYCHAESMVLEADKSGTLTEKYGIKTVQISGITIPGLSRLRRSYYLSRSKHFILAGGSLFNEGSVHSILSTPYFSSHKPLALGVSVGPFKSNDHEDKVIELMNRMLYVGFRDDYSYNWAISRNISCPFSRSFDLAALMPFVPQKNTSIVPGKKKIGIVPLAFHVLTEKTVSTDLTYIKKFAEHTYEISKEYDADIELYALCTNPNYDDRLVCQAFLDAIPTADNIHIYRHNGDAIETFNALKRCTHVVSMRLHGSVFAYANQLPLLILSYHQKCRDFADTIGLKNDFFLDLRDFDFESYQTSLAKFLTTQVLDATLSLQSAQDRALENFRSYEIWQ
ncbi:polysaccharide pyruvyl transferase family protein [Leptolyngbya sp. FACHB-16]|uniref:polysaccharide pyruvyl transferase family protein n=1 Tax=unclassified Leptolyngbya TaxID=2650499 RepID=UPI0016891F0C|nr:polysaccharide pyruvyl transferase family protein [Leptolyngbya sp. FACHB-16]MBD2156179.1 polysaccharide pyruvyl transferase family protein [Leptolyngbya sp. FACHB-16]